MKKFNLGARRRQQSSKTVAGLSWAENIQQWVEGDKSFETPKTTGQYYVERSRQRRQAKGQTGQYFITKKEYEKQAQTRKQQLPGVVGERSEIRNKSNSFISDFLYVLENENPELFAELQPEYLDNNLNAVIMDKEDLDIVIELYYLPTSDGEFSIILRAYPVEHSTANFSPITLTYKNLTPKSIIEIIEDMLRDIYSTVSESSELVSASSSSFRRTVGAPPIFKIKNITEDIGKLLVLKLTEEDLYQYHAIEENKINLWHDGSEIKLVFVVTPENQLKINIYDSEGKEEIIIRDLAHYDIDTLVEEILIKLREYNSNARAKKVVGIPPIHPDLMLEVPEENISDTINIDAKALEKALLFTARLKDQNDLTDYCSDLIDLGSGGVYLVLNKNNKEIIQKDKAPKNTTILILEPQMLRWLCDWSKDYADTDAAIKKVVKAAEKFIETYNILYVADFPELLRNSMAKNTRKKQSKKKAAQKVNKKKKARKPKK